jgi:hypothetical protein
MRIFFGIFLATITNFFLGIVGFYLASYPFFYQLAPQYFQDDIVGTNYIYSFLLKFLVVLILTWIMYRVMAMLDSPKKRVLFIFLLGSTFSVYYQINIFSDDNSIIWSVCTILGESFNWLLTGYVLSKFVRPKHLGAN